MQIGTPKDSFDRPAMLGNYEGVAVPVKVLEDGSLQVNVENFPDGGSAHAGQIPRYELVKSIRLDLSVHRTMEHCQIEFDSFAIGSLEGSFLIHLNQDGSSSLTIDKCLSVGVSAGEIFFSNEAQQGFAEIWFFKIKE